MNRLFAIFSVTAVISAALVAAAATGTFSGGSSGAASAAGAGSARPSKVRTTPAGEDPASVEEIQARALEALKQKRDSGEIPREEGQTPSEEAPAFLQGPDLAGRPPVEPPAEEPAAPEAPALPAPRASSDSAVESGEEQPKQGMSPDRIREITKDRAKNDPYKVTGPKVSTDPFSGTTIINTDPFAP